MGNYFLDLQYIACVYLYDLEKYTSYYHYSKFHFVLNLLALQYSLHMLQKDCFHISFISKGFSNFHNFSFQSAALLFSSVLSSYVIRTLKGLLKIRNEKKGERVSGREISHLTHPGPHFFRFRVDSTPPLIDSSEN